MRWLMVIQDKYGNEILKRYGFGDMYDVQISLGYNEAGELTFNIPPRDACYKYMITSEAIISVYACITGSSDKLIIMSEVREVSTNVFGVKSVYCMGILSWLNHYSFTLKTDYIFLSNNLSGAINELLNLDGDIEDSNAVIGHHSCGYNTFKKMYSSPVDENRLFVNGLSELDGHQSGPYFPLQLASGVHTTLDAIRTAFETAQVALDVLVEGSTLIIKALDTMTPRSQPVYPVVSIGYNAQELKRLTSAVDGVSTVGISAYMADGDTNTTIRRSQDYSAMSKYGAIVRFVGDTRKTQAESDADISIWDSSYNGVQESFTLSANSFPATDNFFYVSRYDWVDVVPYRLEQSIGLQPSESLTPGTTLAPSPGQDIRSRAIRMMVRSCVLHPQNPSQNTYTF